MSVCGVLNSPFVYAFSLLSSMHYCAESGMVSQCMAMALYSLYAVAEFSGCNKLVNQVYHMEIILVTCLPHTGYIQVPQVPQVWCYI